MSPIFIAPTGHHTPGRRECRSRRRRTVKAQARMPSAQAIRRAPHNGMVTSGMSRRISVLARFWKMKTRAIAVIRTNGMRRRTPGRERNGVCGFWSVLSVLVRAMRRLSIALPPSSSLLFQPTARYREPQSRRGAGQPRWPPAGPGLDGSAEAINAPDAPRSPRRHSATTFPFEPDSVHTESAPLGRTLSIESAGAGQPQGEVAVLVDDLIFRQVTVLAVPDRYAHP